MSKDLVRTALSIIQNITGSAIIGSVDDKGYPNIKAMLKPREHDGIKAFYFTTNTSSMRVKHFNNNPKASIYFYDSRYFRGVMLLGTIKVLKDKAVKKRIWRDGDEMYYKKGITDPDYCLLKFTTQTGRIYQHFRSEDFKL